MFNVGGGELLVILLVALIVLGPQRLPGAARQVGKVMGDVRRISSGFQNELKNAFEAEPTPSRPEPVPLARAVADEDAKAADPAGTAPAAAASAAAAPAPRPAGDADAPRPLRRVEPTADGPGLAAPVADALDEVLAPPAATTIPASTAAAAVPDDAPPARIAPDAAETRAATPPGTDGVGDAGGPAGGHRAAS